MWCDDVTKTDLPALHIIIGTPEVGGLTTVQALEIVRGCRGLNIIGGDVVEV